MAPVNETIQVFVVIHEDNPEDQYRATDSFMTPITSGATAASPTKSETSILSRSTNNSHNNSVSGHNAFVPVNTTLFQQDAEFTFNASTGNGILNASWTDYDSISKNDSYMNDTWLSWDKSNGSDVGYNFTLGESPLVVYSYEFSLFIFFVIILGVLLSSVFLKFLRVTSVSFNVRGGLWYSMTVCNLLLSGLVSVLLFLALSKEEWPLQPYLCQTYLTSLHILTAFSNNCAACMILERYVFMKKKSREIKKNPALRRQSVYIDDSYKKYTALLLIATITWSLSLGLPPSFGWSYIKLDQKRLACWLSLSSPNGLYYIVYFVAGTIVLPVVIIIIVYYLHNKTVAKMTVKLQKNRHRSSVVKLAMRVTKASTSSGPSRRSISSLSSVIIKDAQNFIRHPLTQEVHKECHLLRQHIIWGSVGIATSLPYILANIAGIFISFMPPESPIIASLLFKCNSVVIPILIAALHDPMRKDMKKFLTDTLCFVPDDVVPTAVVAPTAYRSGERRESIQSRRKSIISQKQQEGEEMPMKKPERRASQVTIVGVNAFGRPALTPIVERPSLSGCTPSPQPSPVCPPGDLGPSPSPARKDAMVIPPRPEQLDTEAGHGEEGILVTDIDTTENHPTDREGPGEKIAGGENPREEGGGKSADNPWRGGAGSTGGCRTHNLNAIASGDDLPQIT